MSVKSIYKSPSGEKAIMAAYNSVLDRWPVPVEKLYVPTRHGQTFVIVSGDNKAPALVLLHGSSSNAVSWIGEVAQYSRLFRTYAVDIPGEVGRSSHNRPSWHNMALAEWIEDVLDYLKIEKASLLGLSLGGWVALRFAAYKPERVEKLVLLAPAGVVNERIFFLLRVILYMPFGLKGGRAINRIVCGKDTIDREVLKYMDLIMTHFRPRTESLRIFNDEELKRLSMPVLLIGGDRDAIRDVKKIDGRMKKLVTKLTTVILPDRGHVLINLSDRIIPFLSGREYT
jgi:pimeloyl-ACP methyl ester carboxylesterase